MLDESVSLYDVYGATSPPLPSRSRLYHLQPISVGRSDCESLTSYVMRLASAHSISLRVLYIQELSPLENPLKIQPNKNKHSCLYSAQVWNGTGKNAKRMVKTLELLTLMQRLDVLTLLPWRDVLPTQFLLRHERAWCPCCYEQWKGAGKVIYEPLLWTVNVVKVCPYHLRSLETVCPHCMRRAKPLAVNSRTGHCSRCQNWLGNNEETSSLSKSALTGTELDYQIWIAKSVGEVIAASLKLNLLPSKEGITRTIRECVNRYTSGNVQAFARYVRIRKNTVSLWHVGRNIPRFDILLKMCQRMELPAVQFLTSTVFDDNEVADSTQELFQPLTIPPHRDHNKVREAKVLEVFEDALKENPPPSLSIIADRLGYKFKSSLYLKYADLCKKVMARYKTYLKAQGIPLLTKRVFLDECAEKHLRQLLEQELEKPCPDAPNCIVKSLSSRCRGPVYQRFPDLWQKIMLKRSRFMQHSLNKRLKKARHILNDALKREPPDTLKMVIESLGYKSGDELRKYFPEECKAISTRHAYYRNVSINKKLKAALEQAVEEDPPMSMMAVSRRLRYDLSFLYKRFSGLCHSISARYAAYRKECSERKRLTLKDQVRSIAIELHERGLHPSEERIKPLLIDPPIKCYTILNEVLREIRKELDLPNR
jgi:hypothetical protein